MRYLREQNSLLRNISKLLTKFMLFHFTDIYTIQRNISGCHIIETWNQIYQRRLTASGTSNDCCCLTRLRCKCNIFQNIFICTRITERYMIESKYSFSVFWKMFSCFGSWIIVSLFNTSSTRSAATAALGSIIEIIQSIKNPIMICIVYWINAIISPTCICPSLIPCAPVHTIRTDTPFMTNIITGIINVIARLTKDSSSSVCSSHHQISLPHASLY